MKVEWGPGWNADRVAAYLEGKFERVIGFKAPSHYITAGTINAALRSGTRISRRAVESMYWMPRNDHNAVNGVTACSATAVHLARSPKMSFIANQGSWGARTNYDDVWIGVMEAVIDHGSCDTDRKWAGRSYRIIARLTLEGDDLPWRLQGRLGLLAEVLGVPVKIVRRRRSGTVARKVWSY